MALSSWQVKELKLSEPQQYALLLLGARQTRQDKHQMVRVCRAEDGGYSKPSYWSGIINFASRKKDASRSKKAIRVKTFLAMEKKGFILLSDTDATSKYELTAQLTDLGWEIFDYLAQRSQNIVDVYDRRLAALTAEEKAKPKVWDVCIKMRRKVVKPEYQHADESYTGIEAATAEAAMEIARDKFAEDEAKGDMSWYKDANYYRSNDAEAFWGEQASDDGVKAEHRTVEMRVDPDPDETNAELDEAFKMRASNRVREEMTPPWRLKGVTAYVNEGKRAPYLMDKVLKETGGIRLDDALAEDAPDEPDTEIDPEDDANLQRFAMMDLE